MNGIRNRWVAVVALMATAAMMSSACGGDTNPKDDDDASEGPPTITIVTYSSFVLDDTVKARVEDELDVQLEVRASGDSAEALSAAILTAGRPEGDIFFGVDNTLLTRALSADLFDEVESVDIPNLEAVPDDLRLDRSGRMVPIDVGPVCVDFDREWFDEHQLVPPANLEELTLPLYKDLLVVESPVTSSPGLVFLMATYAALGDGAEQWWADLVSNGVSVAGSWDDAWNAQYTVNGGDRPLVVSYASSPPAEVFYSEGALEKPRTGVIESTCAEQIEFAGVLAGGGHPEEARDVLNAMLAEPWQASLPLTNFVFPARDDVTLPDVFESFAVRPATVIELDPEVVDAERDARIDRWRQQVE